MAFYSYRRMSRIVPLWLAAVSLTGCSAVSATARTGASFASVAAISTVPSDRATDVALDSPVTVRSDGGLLDSVSVHQEGVTPLAGQFNVGRDLWTASDPLDANATYTVEATAHDQAGDQSSAHTTFTTLKGVSRLTTQTFPADQSTVGVGAPIRLQFNAPIDADRQQNLIQHVSVQTDPPVTGAWHWFTASEVHWRPKDFWTSGTHVTITANLRDVDAGNNVWGLGNWSSLFTIGEKHVSIIDAATHQMQVMRNDQTVYNFPISAGRANLPTLSGILAVWAKIPDVLMDSQTIGIPRNSPDGYYEHVYLNVAISTDGFYVHDAPWSVGAQGYTNVSHGCVNLSPANAQTFYSFSQPGDVVQVINTSRTANFGDGEADWQIPFEHYANSGVSPTSPTPHPGLPGGN